MTFNWSETKISILRTMFPTTDTPKVAEMIGCSSETVNRMAKRLGVQKSYKIKQREWSEDEISVLKEMYQLESPTAIGIKLGRTSEAVVHMAHRLGIQQNPLGLFYGHTFEQIRDMHIVQGKGLTEIAKIIGAKDHRVIWQYFKIRNVPIKRIHSIKCPRPPKDELVLWTETMTSEQMAKHYHISLSTLFKWFQQYDIRLGRKGRHHYNADFGRRIQLSGHEKFLDMEIDRLRSEGFLAIPIGKIGFPKADGIAFKDGKVYAIEVQTGRSAVDAGKYDIHRKSFDGIIWTLVDNGKQFITSKRYLENKGYEYRVMKPS